jgi:hypothetical protein
VRLLLVPSLSLSLQRKEGKEYNTRRRRRRRKKEELHLKKSLAHLAAFSR